MSQGGPSHGCNGEVCEGSSASTDTGRAAERTSRLCLGRSGRWLSCCRVVGPEVGRTGSGQDGTRIAWSDQVQAQAAFGFGASGLTKPAQRCLLGYAFFFLFFFLFCRAASSALLAGGRGIRRVSAGPFIRHRAVASWMWRWAVGAMVSCWQYRVARKRC